MALFCAWCRAEREFERPPCVDGHDAECPDLVCVDCGLALFAFVADDVLLEPAGARDTVRSGAA